MLYYEGKQQYGGRDLHRTFSTYAKRGSSGTIKGLSLSNTYAETGWIIGDFIMKCARISVSR